MANRLPSYTREDLGRIVREQNAAGIERRRQWFRRAVTGLAGRMVRSRLLGQFITSELRLLFTSPIIMIMQPNSIRRMDMVPLRAIPLSGRACLSFAVQRVNHFTDRSSEFAQMSVAARCLSPHEPAFLPWTQLSRPLMRSGFLSPRGLLSPPDRSLPTGDLDNKLVARAHSIF